MKDYLGAFKQSFPLITAWGMSTALLISGAAFLGFDLYRWMSRLVGLGWTPLLMGLVCLTLGGLGLKLLRS